MAAPPPTTPASTQGTVDKAGILAFQNMDCEKYTNPDDRGNCYDQAAKDSANQGDQKAVEKALAGSFSILIILALIGVGVYFGGTYLKKQKLKKKMAGPVRNGNVTFAEAKPFTPGNPGF
jgi:hypothetical protein